MARLPALPGRKVQKALERAGFQVLRQKGSHIRMKHDDGRIVTVPVNIGRVVGRGLLRKILLDAELSREQFLDLLNS